MVTVRSPSGNAAQFPAFALATIRSNFSRPLNTVENGSESAFAPATATKKSEISRTVFRILLEYKVHREPCFVFFDRAGPVSSRGRTERGDCERFRSPRRPDASAHA